MGQDQIIIYQTSTGETRIDVKLEGETLWLNQKLMSQLFDKDSDTIGLHIKNIFTEGGIGRGFNYRVFLGSSTGGKKKGKKNFKVL